MSMGNLVKHIPLFYQVANTTTFTVASGAVGWIDTDCSSVLRRGDVAVWTAWANNGLGQVVGARADGDTEDSSVTQRDQYDTVVLVSNVGAAGIVELYRGAKNCDYTLKGYWR